MVTTPTDGATVDETVLEAIRDSGLIRVQQQLIFGLQIRRLDHIAIHSDRDYKEIGLSTEEIRQLRHTATQIEKARAYSQSGQRSVFLRNETAAPVIDPNKTVITKEQIKLMELLGEGTFAVVKRAIWYHPEGKKIDVAVKILRDVSPLVMEDLQVEAGHLLKLKHANLIQLYGVVQHPAMMVFELCEGGALLDRLRDSNKPVPLLTSLLEYCMQIVKAMCYLEAKHCVHRDLAARNILLTSDEKNVKICDFGLMRNLKENEQMYIMGPQKRVPFSWCPPESLKHRKFSHASDVWAFGVTVWEIFSLGEEPWIGCRAIDVLKRLDAGERLEMPEQCSVQVYDLVSLCWNVSPEKRPRFNQLRGFLQQAQFNVAEVRDATPMNEEKAMEIRVGDRIVVIQDNGIIWFGQNERTRKFGKFLRNAVFVRGKGFDAPAPRAAVASPGAPSKPLPMTPTPAVILPLTSREIQGNSRISAPIKGSFIHTGHGDVGGQSWGNPKSIDDIYLKNPVKGAPLIPGMPIVVTNILEKAEPTTAASRIAPPPPSNRSRSNTARPVDFSSDWSDFDYAQTPNFSPSKIELPTIHSAGPSFSSTASSSTHNSARDVWSGSNPILPRRDFTTERATNLIIPTVSGTASIHLAPSPSHPQQVLHSSSPSTSHHSLPTAPPPVAPHKHINNQTVLTPTPMVHKQPNVLGNGMTRPHVELNPIPRPNPLDMKRFENVLANKTIQPGVSMGIPLTKMAPNARELNNGPGPSGMNNQANKPTRTPSISYNPSVVNELSQRIISQRNPPPPSGSSGRPPQAPQTGPAPTNITKNTHTTSTTVTGRPMENQIGNDPFMIQPSIQEMVHPRQATASHNNSGPSRTAAAVQPNQNQAMQNRNNMAQPIQNTQPVVLRPNVAMPTNTQPSISRTSPPIQSIVGNVASVVATGDPLKQNQFAGLNQPQKVALPPVISSASPETSRNQNPVVMRAAAVEPLRPASAQPSLANRAELSEADRRSRIEEEIRNMLPAPSQLFYGKQGTTLGTGTIPKASSTSQLPRRSSLTSLTTALPSAVVAPVQPVPHPVSTVVRKPDPLPLSSMPLQPTRLPVNYPAPPAAAASQVTQPPTSRPHSDSAPRDSRPVQQEVRPNILPQAPPTSQVPIFALSNQQNNYPTHPNYGMGCGYSPGIYCGSNFGYGAYPYGGQGGYGGYGGVQAIGPGPSILPAPLEPIPRFQIGEMEDIIEALDPCRPRASTSTAVAEPAVATTPPASATGNGLSMAQQMEMLYDDAQFAERSSCDEMVAKCNGSIETALKELKMEHILLLGITTDKGRAYNALETKGWDLERAIEALL